MSNRIVAGVWIVGVLLAVFIYGVGPDNALQALFGLADTLGRGMQHLAASLASLAESLDGRASDVMRALAIACFAIFFVLCVIATGRGLNARWLLLWVSVLFLLLVWHQGREANGHWLLAFALAAGAALQITRRLGVAV